MVKRVISSRPKKFTKNLSKPKVKNLPEGFEEWDPEQEICEGPLIKDAIWECLLNNDPEGVVEMIEIYMEATNKKKSREKNKLAHSTMYHAIRSKNPTIKTLCKLIHCCM